ncbi:Hypothetical protein SCF082_LOCUS710 [Durusdinium trenchii]|uniref:Uncharacterized protein n=1 Tax=Durusdinium trenchii TaxID=1381693 RepID=A0ABP0H9F2_9DINO
MASLDYQQLAMSQQVNCCFWRPEEKEEEVPEVDNKVSVDLPADVYGLAISVATSDLPHLIHGGRATFHVLRLIFGLGCLALNLWLQFMIVNKVTEFIVTRSVHKTQENYIEYHRQVFDSKGNFLHDVWLDWDGPKAELCSMALSKISFTSTIIFLWTIRMLSEVTTCLQLTLDIFKVPLHPGHQSHGLESHDSEPMLKRHTVLNFNYDRNEVESLDVVHIEMPARICLALCVTLPKLAIGVILLWGGCRWFAATESWEDLILNALALEFVISIDELILDAFAPLRMKQTIEKTKLIHVFEDGKPKKTEARIVSTIIWKLSLLILCMVWAYVYLAYLQQVIPNFPHDINKPCSRWLEEQSTPMCEAFSNSEVCFPYGE